MTSVTVWYTGTECFHVDNCTDCFAGATCSAGAQGGSCGGTPITCDDGNVCTTDSCALYSGCVNTNNTNSCDDSTFCSGTDTCLNGSCRVHSGNPCGPGQVCCEISDTCADECCDDAECDDGLFCNGDDTCSGGSCSHTGDPCGVELVCNESTGHCDCDDDGDCEDGQYCTIDTCNTGTGQCSSSSRDCGDEDSCTDDSCNETTDECVNIDDGEASEILKWESVVTHGTVGDVGLAIEPLPQGYGDFSEPRLSGLSKLVVTYSAAIDPTTATPAAVGLVGNDVDGSMNLSGITIGTTTTTGNTKLETTFTPKLPDFAKYRVTLTDVKASGGCATGGDNEVIVTALLGDASGDLRVLPADVGGVSNLVAIVGIDPGIIVQVRSDGNNDGDILPNDVGGVSNEVPKDATTITDP